MKNIFLAFVCIILLTACQRTTKASFTASSKTIADITSLSEARSFAVKVLETDSPFYDSKRLIPDSLMPLKWYHADFDSDGRADLLFTFSYLDWRCKLCLIDSGNGRVAKYALWYRAKTADTVDLTKAGGRDAILYPHWKEQRNRNSKERKPILPHDTLIFKFGQFVEYNGALEHHNIERIEYGYYIRFYKMEFDITIHKKTMTITLDSFGRIANGKAERIPLKSSPIDSITYAHLTEVLNYADFADWEYKDFVEPSRMSQMTVYYDRDKTKSLYDCDDLGGGFTLMYFNRLMIQLCKERNWNRYVDPDKK